MEENDMDAKEIIEVEDIKKLDIILSEDTALQLMELMGIIGEIELGDAIQEIINRTHNREVNDREWKERVGDRRKILKKEKEEIQEKLNKISEKTNWKKLILKRKNSKLKSEKKKIDIRLKEQLRTYRMVSKIE